VAIKKYRVRRELTQFIEVQAEDDRQALHLAKDTMDSLWHTDDIDCYIVSDQTPMEKL
jgi:phosphopantetheine adenylyltransferase